MNELKLLSLVFFLCCTTLIQGQTTLVLKSLSTNEVVPFAVISDPGNPAHFAGSNLKGEVVWNFLCDSICIQHISFQDTCLALNEVSGHTIYLKGIMLDEVVINANKNRVHKNALLNLEYLKSTPGVGGELDIIKNLSLTPGVLPVVEASTSLSVRGGSADQNLILIDGAKLYSTSHLFGLLSPINDKMVQDLHFYKSYIPAELPSRGSSVIDISMQSGSVDSFRKEITIGLLNSSFKVDGPIHAKKNITFGLSGRTAYNSLLLAITSLGNPNEKKYYTVFDLDGKLAYQMSSRTNLSLTVHANRDFWDIIEQSNKSKDQFGFNWGNTLLTSSLKHKVNKKTFLDINVNTTSYALNFKGISRNEEYESQIFSSNSIREWNGSVSLSRQLSSKQNLLLGSQYELRNIKPVESKFNENNTTFSFKARQDLAQTSSWFATYTYHPLKNLEANFGLRYEYYMAGDKTSRFHFWQPKFAVQYSRGSDLNFFFEAQKTNQSLHSLSSGNNFFFIDMWLPAGSEALPQNITSSNLGFSKRIKKMDFGAEVYYKKLSNQLYNANGEFFLLPSNYDWQSNISTKGIGKAYGIETYASVIFNDNLKLNMNYTLSWSQRQFSDINQGNWFYFDTDRRHALNFTMEKRLGKKWTFNGNFVFYSGNPLTLPSTSILTPQNRIVPVVTEINGFRNKAYNRLDVAFSRSTISKMGHEKTLSFSLYNAYAYRNPFGVYAAPIYKFTGFNSPVDSYQLAFKTASPFRIIPGISYSIKF